MDISCRLSSLTGLTGRQVEAKKAQGRQNILPESAAKPTWQILRENICTLFNLFNVLIAIALALVGAWSNMLFILVIALNTLIGIAQELHAKKLVERLTLLSTPMARVIRDGITGDIPLQELVEEDVVELEAGSQVCADCIMLTGEAEVNESLLTGEAEPVLRKVGDRLLSGSYIVSGRCRACVEHVGAENYAAKVTQAAQKQRRARSELLSSMRQVTRFTGCLIPPLGLLLFFEAYFLRFDTLDHAVTATAAALLGMLSKGLVLLISISLAAGIISLSRKKVLVQELFALETLAHVDTLCLDKTGTITQGRMRVEKVLATQRGKKLAFNDLMGAFLHISKDNNGVFPGLPPLQCSTQYPLFFGTKVERRGICEHRDARGWRAGMCRAWSGRRIAEKRDMRRQESADGWTNERRSACRRPAATGRMSRTPRPCRPHPRKRCGNTGLLPRSGRILETDFRRRSPHRVSSRGAGRPARCGTLY